MARIRPVAEPDLDALLGLAGQATFGLTTLPRDRELLARRIRESARAFELVDERPRGESYLLVLEGDDGRIVGTAGIVSKVGGFEPFYAYRIETTLHVSEVLKVRKEIRTLHLVQEHDGPCEIGSLFLAPAARGRGSGRLLSLARFLFMAERPQLFDPRVIAEMRGVIDEHGRSPFWDAVGRHFFEIDFPTADYLSVVDKRFIAELMPTHPLYISLLPTEAQGVIGRVHPKTEPALRLLESEGFRLSGMVDIFEGGPIVSCPLTDIRIVRESVRATVVDASAAALDAPPHLVAGTRPDFRACVGAAVAAEGGVRVTAETARLLEVRPGDTIRYATLSAGSSSSDGTHAGGGAGGATAPGGGG
jgi:arginine N-succinyltransferase